LEGVNRFIDAYAEDDDENSEEIDRDGQVYDEKDLARKHTFNINEFE
jgi:hypothetical protein